MNGSNTALHSRTGRRRPGPRRHALQRHLGPGRSRRSGVGRCGLGATERFRVSRRLLLVWSPPLGSCDLSSREPKRGSDLISRDLDAASPLPHLGFPRVLIETPGENHATSLYKARARRSPRVPSNTPRQRMTSTPPTHQNLAPATDDSPRARRSRSLVLSRVPDLGIASQVSRQGRRIAHASSPLGHSTRPGGVPHFPRCT